MRKAFVGAVLMLAGLMLPCPTQADPPWTNLKPFRRVPADPDRSYVLSEQNGPWMIFAASFAGEGAEADAQRVIYELRKRFRLPAYIHKQHYDFTDKVQGLGLDKYGRPKQMRYRQEAAFDEFAVLVGNYETVDDPDVQKTLKTLKFSQLQSLQLDNQQPTTLRFAGLRAFHRRLSGDEEKLQKGPLGQAFVTRNPLLPDEYFVPRGVDSLVASMNEGVRYSLLDCPGKFTVRVATFRGNVIIDPKEIYKVEQTGKMESKLHEAAERAHRLTQLLRQKGVEAYEFHDRYESTVTVGSFASVGNPRSDGRTEIDPRVLRIMESYGARQSSLPGTTQQAGLMPRTLGGIPFDVQPVPVKVPKRSVASDYAQDWSLLR